MASQDEIRAAERTRLEGLVDEHGSERERATLLFSGIKRSGITLARLAEAHAAGESVGRLPAEPAELARITRRIERRVRLKLPNAECAQDQPFCTCLVRALDEPGDEGKREVLKLAARFHKRTKREPARPPATPDPQENLASPQEATEHVDDVYPRPEPTPKAQPRVRVVHRTRKWFDPPTSFRDMKF